MKMYCTVVKENVNSKVQLTSPVRPLQPPSPLVSTDVKCIHTTVIMIAEL